VSERAEAADAGLRRLLLAWYAAERRLLPWRADRDPYRVWISEAMLQQTRVATVIPYFERFVARFPDCAALARAPLEDVLAHWSGLGYYRRARTLHEAARTIVERHRGRFPERREDVLALPGVGPYTAGAVLSIAYGQREPLVDGNVARVFARLFGIEGVPGARVFEDELWRRARELVPERGAGEWNQALMELGALVCTPREPRCDACPVREHCVALASGRTGLLPTPKPRPAVIEVELEILLVSADGRVLLERRPPAGRMAGLWQLPTRERVAPPRTEPLLFPADWPLASGEECLRADPGAELGTVRHTITRHRIRARVRGGELRSASLPETLAWFEGSRIAELALTGMAKKALATRFVAEKLATVGRPG
jgi:A/G-specific adenine glycosylase